MNRSVTSRVRVVAGALVLAGVGVTAAACTPGSAPSSGGSPSASPATTGFDTTQKVTITVADGWGKTGTGETFGKVLDNFQKKYPNVTVTRETTDYDSYQQSINLRGSSPNPPDVMMLETSGYGQGFYQFVRSGLLLPLDDYAKAYGWTDRFGDKKNLDVFRMDHSNKDQWGSGTLYGVPEQNSMMTVFYNKKLLSQAGVNTPPATFADFEKSLAAAKAQGVVPIAQSNSYIHLEMALWNSMVKSADDVNSWVFGKEGATFATDANTKAAQLIADWQRQGYFQDGVSGATYSDAAGTFLDGKALYYVEGSWMTGAAEGSLKDAAGAFMMPAAVAGQATPAAGGFSTPLAISSKTQHADVAAAFLDYFVSQENSDFLFSNGWGLPGGTVSATTARGTSLTNQVLSILTPVQATGGAGSTPFLDWATPSLTSELPAALQKMASGADSPVSFVQTVQGNWTTFHQQRKAS